MRTCIDCDTPSPGTRCTTCQQQKDKARWDRKAHRYGPNHRATRTAWAPLVATGGITCSRYPDDPKCPGLIGPTEPWDLDHLDDGEHPAHSACNRRAGAHTHNMQP